MSDEGVVYFSTEKTTVRSILADCANRAADYRVAVVLLIDQNDQVAIAHSDGHLLEKVGMCHVAANYFEREMSDGI